MSAVRLRFSDGKTVNRDHMSASSIRHVAENLLSTRSEDGFVGSVTAYLLGSVCLILDVTEKGEITVRKTEKKRGKKSAKK